MFVPYLLVQHTGMGFEQSREGEWRKRERGKGRCLKEGEREITSPVSSVSTDDEASMVLGYVHAQAGFMGVTFHR